jgi:hypothetical protein
MPIAGSCPHPGVRSLLEFESTRLGIPLNVRHQNLAWAPLEPADRIDVLVHEGNHSVDFGLWVDGVVTPISTPLWLPEEGARVFGPPDPDGVLQPLVSVHGYQVVVHIAPAALAGLAVRVLGPALEQALVVARDALDEQVLQRQTDHYVEVRLSEVNMRLETRRSAERETFRALQRAEDEVRSQYRKLAAIKEDIDTVESCTLASWKRAARQDMQKLLAMVPRAIQRVRLDGDRLVVTTNPITIQHDGYDYEMGRFEIRIDIPARLLKVHGIDQEVNSYSHPHIHVDGTCCLGNYGPLVADCLARQDHLGLVVGLIEFLRAYNPSSPYQDLRRWNPDWRDEERYESCYEDSAPSDCVDCSDDACPYHDGRYDRCWEYQDSYTDCVDCGNCGWAQEARRQCREQQTPQECVECRMEMCSYAGDTGACFETHDGEECPDCDNNNCQHHPGDGEEENE